MCSHIWTLLRLPRCPQDMGRIFCSVVSVLLLLFSSSAIVSPHKGVLLCLPARRTVRPKMLREVARQPVKDYARFPIPWCVNHRFAHGTLPPVVPVHRH